MKRTIIFLLLFAAFNYAEAQPGHYSTSDTKAIKLYESGKDHYEIRNMIKAAEDLQKASERDLRFIEPYLMLYQVYYEQGRYTDARLAIRQAVTIDDEFFPNALFFLADLEMGEGMYAEAEEHLRRFKKLDPYSDNLIARSNRYLATCEFAQIAMENPVPFEPKNMGPSINSADPEYYPCLTTDDATMLFTRLIKDEKAYGGVQEELLISSLNENGDWQPSRGVPPINTTMNEGAATLSPDGQILVFTACELHGDWGVAREGMGACDLFYSVKRGGQWGPPINFGQPINTMNWESQPSMSADGKTLYFIRGRSGPGGVQDQDIFVTKLQDDGNWGRPIRLPRVINTKESEESVMIHPDGRTLYFSSDGHLGMGGLDIFMSQQDDDGLWSEPKNLGYPINTHKDENSLLVSSSGDLAYFASNREGGYGSLDLYSFELPMELRPDRVNYMIGKVIDAVTRKPVEAELSLLALMNGEQLAGTFSDKVDGEFLISLPTVKDLALNVSAPHYMFYSENFNVDKSSGEAMNIIVELQPIKAGAKIILENVFFETNKFDLKEESRVELDILVGLMKREPELRVEVGGHTDNVGSAANNLELSGNRSNSVKAYLASKGIEAMRIETKGYGAAEPIKTNDTDEGRARNRRVELKIL